MKTKLAILAVASLTACATPPADRFRVEWTDDPAKACGGEALIGHIQGCSRREGDTCVIHARRPRSENDATRLTTLGHELLHCTDGPWHDRWGRMVAKEVK